MFCTFHLNGKNPCDHSIHSLTPLLHSFLHWGASIYHQSGSVVVPGGVTPNQPCQPHGAYVLVGRIKKTKQTNSLITNRVIWQRMRMTVVWHALPGGVNEGLPREVIFEVRHEKQEAIQGKRIKGVSLSCYRNRNDANVVDKVSWSQCIKWN